jgi:hypothetical protein
MKTKWVNAEETINGNVITSISSPDEGKRIVEQSNEYSESLGNIIWLTFEDGSCNWFPAHLPVQIVEV